MSPPADDLGPAFPVSPRNKLRRHPERGGYDEAAVFAILDAAVVAHVGYVLDGQPFVTPTAIWRVDRRLYWHGAAASRMLDATGAGAPVCVTVTHLDGLVLARSGFAHSLNYRSAMAFGRARTLTALDAKREALDRFVDRLYPGRSAILRPATDAELMQISLVEMEIEQASAKVREGGVKDYRPDEGWPAWFGVLPVRTTLGAPQPDAAAPAGLDGDLAHLAPGAALDAALTAAAAQSALPVSA